MVNEYWTVEYDDLLEFWDIGIYGTDSIWRQVTAAMDESIAQHVVQLHNKWYQNEVYSTYVDNITLSAINVVIREIIENLDDEPEERQFWEEQLLTDVAQLPDAPHVLAI
jgi:hypothetical protein